ncbi:LysR family transcriptional regulator [Sphingomonas alba]|uniref:LysR family transcriptional regulator n=1 Tax=Sphingomonas alba TaxID=2908208 RepID=A0ABT0RQG3_9SPHN|nr:LysR family transcriptional regulator [Sphingomonas alba]MCL6684712.1 LysR family transcriptional regulator [Sphingomonas alba]
MDRIEAMKVFIAALDQGSLAAAGRLLKRSPAAVSRAIASLENQVGVELLHRTTRTIRLSEAGERYAAACRRILTEIDEADLLALGEKSAPRGVLTLTAPPVSGEDILRPVLDRFLDAFPMVSARLLLLDRQVNLVDEGVDIALRVGDLPDSSLIATRVGSDVRRVVVASPEYLASHPQIFEPVDLSAHKIIAFTNFGLDSWTFPPAPGSSVPRAVRFNPRLTVNSVRAAVTSAAKGKGLTRLYSYHVADAVRARRLQVVLADAEFPPLPVHLLTPTGRASVPKVRAFLDLATPQLKAIFARLAVQSRELR